MTTLGMTNQGQFTLNGVQTFLLGLTYFDGINARQSDLVDFKERGYNALRIMLDWPNPSHAAGSFFNSDGTLKTTEKAQLLAFIRAADVLGIVIELVILNGTTDAYITTGGERTTAIQSACAYFGNEPNVMFDVCNEIASTCAFATTFASHDALLDTAQAATSAICFVSGDGGTTEGDGPMMDWTTNAADASYLTSWMANSNDLCAPHFKGDADWWSSKAALVANLRAWLDANGHAAKPIWINEDNRWGVGYGDLGAGDIEADKYLATILMAKQNRAAGCLHHDDASYDMSVAMPFRNRFANADAQDVFDRLGAYVAANGQSRIQFDAHSESAVGSGVSTRSWTHTVRAGLINGCLVVGTAARGNSAANLVVSSVTYNGVSMTKQREDISADIGGPEFAGTSLWTLVNPPAGALTVLVTYTGSVTNIVTAWATSRARVNQTSPVNAVSGATSAGGSALATTSVTTTVPGCLIIDSQYSGIDTAQTVGGAQTVRSNRIVTGASTDNVGASEQAAPARCTTPMTWEFGASFWAISALALVEDAVPPLVCGGRRMVGWQ